MAAMRRDRPLFSQYDDELADSDQTITGIARVRKATSTTAASARSRSSGRPQPRASKSAFFSDTTTDDEGKQAPRRAFASAAPPNSRQQDAGQPYARLYLGDIQFPSTRHVLWDRRILAERLTISSRQILPRVTISNAALKEIFRLYWTYAETNKDRLHLQNASVLGYLHGETATRSAKELTLSAVASPKELNRLRASGVWILPVYAISNQSTPQLPQEVYKKLISTAQCALAVDTDDNIASKLQSALLVSSSTSNSSAQVDLQLECFLPPVHFSFGLIRNLPLLMTPLAASLARGEFGSGDMARRSGYITLDRARKAVPLLKSDPLVMQRPIVGLWIYGISLPDAWDDGSAQIQLADPYLLFMCLGYLLSQSIKDRVEISQNTFLVALYPCSTPGKHSSVSALPRFFECSYPEYLDSKDTLPMDLFAQEKPCLAGVSTFKSDLEFLLTPSGNEAWTNATIAMNIPGLQSPNTTNSEENKQLANETHTQSSFANSLRPKKSSNVIRSTTAPRLNDQGQPRIPESRSEESADVAIRDVRVGKSEARVFFTLSDEQKSDNLPALDSSKLEIHEHGGESAQLPASLLNDAATHEQHTVTSGSQSCCKSQQLLTIQHQQILENQQRQLHEMQEQIAQLRRLLYDSRQDQDKEADAHLHKPAQNQDDRVESSSDQFEGSIRSDSGSLLDDQSDRSLHEDSMSSLELSSITNGSHASELSSLSLSMVGSRVGNLREGTARQDEGLGASRVSIGSSVTDTQQPSAEHLEENVHAEKTYAEETERSGNVDHEQTEQLAEPLDRELSLADIDTKREDIENPTPAHELANEDEDDDQSSISQKSDRLVIPESHLAKSETSQVVKFRGATNYTSVPMDMHSFCIPRINFDVEPSFTSDSEDEEVMRIERKYASLFLS